MNQTKLRFIITDVLAKVNILSNVFDIIITAVSKCQFKKSAICKPYKMSNSL